MGRTVVTLSGFLLWILLASVESFSTPALHHHQSRRNCRLATSRLSHLRSSDRKPSTALDMVSVPATAAAATTSTFLVRIVFLRAMAFVYGVAFLVALRQNKALIGDNGITPARYILDQAEARGEMKQERRGEWRRKHQSAANNVALKEQDYLSGVVSNTKVVRWMGARVDANKYLLRLRKIFWDRSDRLDRPVTSVLWLAKDRNKLDPWLDRIAITGLLLSAAVMTLGAANVPLLLGLWVCQRSLMAVGGAWYGFGWEPQLAELGFHALFLVPLLSLNPLPSMPVPAPVLWTLRWFLFRIMIGAGLIKIRSGDKKWRRGDLTAMNYFYETQPVPNPLTRYLHWLPKAWHKGEVLLNYFVELVAPWLLVVPGLPVGVRRAGGIIQLAFQSALISSGNLSFLNWLTMVPAIACLDDAFLARMFTASTREAASVAATTASTTAPRQVVSWAFFALVLRLSIPVVRNLISKRQVMNSSFDPLRLVNTYGAFGTVSEEREEIVISSAIKVEGPWREYEFQVKPGGIRRIPRWISPYHHRLDWQMWIASTCKRIDRSPWLYNFLLKLLDGDEQVMKLLAKDPWEGSEEAPRYIRADTFRYKFHQRIKGEKDPPYWDRFFVKRFYPRQGLATISSLTGEVRH